ncbi:YihY/virulence factor BrkB family protein [Domibacillus robiginosus]|uniref:YihY/virulence factor BrkB family protein n=1 Tax=Domibacillus robiginosus TaxID=1071054 RepID=UPI00067D5346|nr:YihY/virulence factor BrkB family protein [Domibacillus robiginosus]
MNTAQRIMSRFFAERFYDQAAQTAYYLLLSAIPFIIFMLSFISFFPMDQQAILDFARPYAPGESFALIEENVAAVLSAEKGQVLSLSLLSTFWLSSMAVQSLGRSLNDAFRIERDLPFWQGLLRDFGVTLIFMVMVPLSVVIPLLEKVLRWLVSQSDTLEHISGLLDIWPAAQWGIGTLFLFAFFIAFYKIVPNDRLTVPFVLPGALFAAIGWQVVSSLFGSYAAAVSYTRLYGQLSGIIVLVLWFYLTAVVILIGGLLNAEKGQKHP